MFAFRDHAELLICAAKTKGTVFEDNDIKCKNCMKYTCGCMNTYTYM